MIPTPQKPDVPVSYVLVTVVIYLAACGAAYLIGA